MSALNEMELELLKQAGGLIGHPDYTDSHGIARAMKRLEKAGLIEREWEDDQPTAYATIDGEMLLERLGLKS